MHGHPHLILVSPAPSSPVVGFRFHPVISPLTNYAYYHASAKPHRPFGSILISGPLTCGVCSHALKPLE
jgi:hypothetical protein